MSDNGKTVAIVITVAISVFLCFLVQECSRDEYFVCNDAEDRSECIEAVTASILEIKEMEMSKPTARDICTGFSSLGEKDECLQAVIASEMEAQSYEYCDCACPVGYGNNLEQQTSNE